MTRPELAALLVGLLLGAGLLLVARPMVAVGLAAMGGLGW